MADASSLTFQLQLPGLKKLVIAHSSVIRGKLELIRDTLDSGITSCLSSGHQETLKYLIEDFKNFQEQWGINGLCVVDAEAESCFVQLDAVKDTAHQMMLANKVNSRLKSFTSFEAQKPKDAVKRRDDATKMAPPKPSKEKALKKLKDLARSDQPPPAAAARDRSSDSSDFSDKEASKPCSEDLRKTFYGDFDNEAEPESLPQPARFSYSDALEEFIETEKTYVRRLQLVYDHYYEGLCAGLRKTAAGRAIAEKMKDVFIDFNTFKQLHSELLNELEDMRKEAGRDLQKLYIGTTMKKYAYMLRLYTTFFSEYEAKSKAVNEWMKKEDSFRNLCTALRNDWPNQEDRLLDITMHMLEPIQRPMRYPLLMERYMKEITSSHPDYEKSQETLDLIKSVTGGLNERVRELENFQKLLMVLRELTFPPDLEKKKDKFVQSWFLRQAQVLKISSKNRLQIRHLVLSNSCLLVCVEKRSSKYVQQLIELFDLQVSLDEKLSADYPNCFRLRTDKRAYDLSFATSSEFDGWLAELQRLEVKFSNDVSEQNEKFPWVALEDKELGITKPMWLKDHDVSQCQACSKSFTATNRRHHCRMCGGVFCGSCSRYEHRVEWMRSEQRVCFFCRHRVCRRDGQTPVLDQEHRLIIDKFNSREVQLREPVIQGYLEVKVDIHDSKKSTAPASLQEWTKMWCTVDENVFFAYKMKKDLVDVYRIVLPMEVKVSWTDAEQEIQLQVQKLETCRLRLSADVIVRSAEKEASRLQDWHSILNEVSLLLNVGQ